MTDPTLISDTPNLLRSLRMVAVPTDPAVPACPEPRRAAGPRAVFIPVYRGDSRRGGHS